MGYLFIFTPCPTDDTLRSIRVAHSNFLYWRL